MGRQTTTILLIRHGETDWNRDGRFQGHTNIPLNEAGRAQARALARRLAGWPIRGIYSSDLKRAAATAAILGQTHNLEPETRPTLRERHGGLFEGHTGAELAILYPEAWAKMRRNGDPPPGSESNHQVAQRVVAEFEDIVARHLGQMAAIITHGGALRLLIAYVLGFPPGETARLKVSGNTGLSIVEFDDHGPYLACLNDMSHLAENGRPALSMD